MLTQRISVLAIPLSLVACGGSSPSAEPPAQPIATSAAPALAHDAPSANAVAAPAPTASPKPSLIELEKESIAKLIAAFKSHDPKAVAALYEEGASMQSPGPDGWDETKGRSDIEARHAGLFAAFPDLDFAVTRAFANGDTVAIEWVASGRNDGAWMGGAATGKRFGLSAASLLTFDADGLFVSDRVYMDEVTVAIQLGKAKGKARTMPMIPTTDPVWTVAGGTPEEAALVDITKNNWPAMWSKKDAAGYENAFTPDAVHREIASPNDFAGKKALMAEYDMYAGSVPDMSVSVDRIFTAGNFAILEFTFGGTQKGPLGPLKPTGKKFTLHGLDVDEFQDKRYSSANSYSNAREFLTQLGAIPRPSLARK